MILLAESTQYIVFAAGLCLLIWLILRRSQSKLSRIRPDNDPLVRTPRPDKRSNLGLVDAPADVARWEVAMHETARDMKAELDSKMVALQVLTRQAQTESERLEAAIQRAQQLGLGAPRDLLDRIENFSATDPPLPPSELAPGQREQIYTLADQGRSPAAIATQTGAPLGEVELALSLRSSSN